MDSQLLKAASIGFNPTYHEDAPLPEQLSSLQGEVVLEFGAPWCGFCQAITPLVEQAFATAPELPHIKVFDGKGKRLGRAFGVRLWPTLIKLHNGEEVGRLVRPSSTEAIQTLLGQTISGQLLSE